MGKLQRQQGGRYTIPVLACNGRLLGFVSSSCQLVRSPLVRVTRDAHQQLLSIQYKNIRTVAPNWMLGQAQPADQPIPAELRPLFMIPLLEALGLYAKGKPIG